MEMKRICAGLYQVNFAYGHTGTVKRLDDGSWCWYITNRDGDIYPGSTARVKRAAEVQMYIIHLILTLRTPT